MPHVVVALKIKKCRLRISVNCQKYRYAKKTQISLDLKKYGLEISKEI
jgi:hypothetical protein